MPERRGSVHEQRHIRFGTDLGRPIDRLPRPHLMVSGLQRSHGYSRLGHFRRKRFTIDTAELVNTYLHRSTGNRSTMQYCGMLDRCMDHSGCDPASRSSNSG
jgi:hypothetical protein